MYQPRVEANWIDAKWDYHKFQSYYTDEVKKKTEEPIDDDKICIVDEYNLSSVHDCFNFKSICEVSSDTVCIDRWLNNNNDNYSFLLDEFYAALGTEMTKSKFFHLFSIIEFCEKNYEKYNESRKLLSKDDVESLTSSLNEKINNFNLDKKSQDNCISNIKSMLVNLTDIGRSQKLLNILHRMGIEKIGCYPYKISLDLLGNIIHLRNLSYHGKNEDEKKYRDANEKLFFICDKILEYIETYCM